MSLSDVTRMDSKARIGLSWLLGARLLLAGLSLGLAVAIDRIEADHGGPGIGGVYWTIVAAFMATIVSARRIHCAANPARFATVQVGIDLTIVTSLVYFSGGSDSVFTVLYALVVLYGAIFLDRRGVGLSCGMAAAGYAFVLFGSEFGWLPSIGGEGNARPLPLLGAYWGFYAGALLVLGMLANTLSAELRRTGAALDRRTIDFRQLRDLHLRTVESIGSGILTTDEAGNVTLFNPEAERITGLASTSAAGRALDDVIPGSGAVVAKTGAESTAEDRMGRNRLPFRTVRGEEIFLGLAASSLMDQKGDPVGHVVIFQDVTDVVSMENELRRSERLAAVGEMAARIAHEIRNPLASISGSVQVLQSSTGEEGRDPESQHLMGIVVREVDRLNHLIGDFLRYSRPAPTQPEAVDLGEIIGEVAEIGGAQAGYGGPRIELDVDEGVIVMADPEQLKAVVWNLWNNAAEAMSGGGEPGCLSARVRRYGQDAAQAQIGSHRKGMGESSTSGPDPGSTAVLEIEDTGRGIAPASLERIFEPFFTTKRDGTGLGLATVQRLVEQQGGSIQVSSRVGEGTCFRVLLACTEVL